MSEAVLFVFPSASLSCTEGAGRLALLPLTADSERAVLRTSHGEWR